MWTILGKKLSYFNVTDKQFCFLNLDEMDDKGSELSEEYHSANPFPHIVIDDFLPPVILDNCLDYFPKENDPESITFDRDQERFKTGFESRLFTCRFAHSILFFKLSTVSKVFRKPHRHIGAYGGPIFYWRRVSLYKTRGAFIGSCRF